MNTPSPPSAVALAYTAWSSRYDSDRNLTRDLDAACTRRLLGDGPVGTLVEAGCGTGKNTRHYAEIASRVEALDFSAGMLAIARERAAAPHVHFQQADLSTTWPCDDAQAEVVSFNLVLEHIQVLHGVFAEAARVLRPGGRVLVSELHPFKQYQGSQARFAGADGNEWRIDAHTHHVSDFLQAASAAGLELRQLDEWWHDEDGPGTVPRLLTLLLHKAPAGAR
jgi:ubiquinone/menaquinone biosynthesis C-methylase UbiE